MTETTLLHTGPLRAHLFAQIEQTLPSLKQKGVRAPKLMVILVGDDPASQVYVRNKQKTAEKLGIGGDTFVMPASTTQDELHAKIDEFNEDDSITAMLVQMPLPKHLDEFAALSRISPMKDVDGLTAVNAGLLGLGRDKDLLIPATPLGCMRILEWANVPTEGAEAVVIGRSNLVGVPVGRLLLRANATVTLCHSRTKNLNEHLKRADIVVAAVGKPHLITGTQLKKGCTVIDVGINSVPAPETEKGYKLLGDVDGESCQGIARIVTPVPGGVGPMTVASLMTNVIDATCLQDGVEMPKWDVKASLEQAA